MRSSLVLALATASIAVAPLVHADPIPGSPRAAANAAATLARAPQPDASKASSVMKTIARQNDRVLMNGATGSWTQLQAPRFFVFKKTVSPATALERLENNRKVIVRPMVRTVAQVEQIDRVREIDQERGTWTGGWKTVHTGKFYPQYNDTKGDKTTLKNVGELTTWWKLSGRGKP